MGWRTHPELTGCAWAVGLDGATYTSGVSFAPTGLPRLWKTSASCKLCGCACPQLDQALPSGIVSFLSEAFSKDPQWLLGSVRPIF